MYGDMECKEPVVKKEEEKPKEMENILPTNPLVPAVNQGWQGEVMGTGLGSFRGIGGTVEHRSGHVGYGGSLKFNMYSPPITSTGSESKLEVMALGQISYYVFPRWYALSKSKKTFDMSVSAQLGYNYITQTVEALNRKSEPVMGFGVKISYPLTDGLRIQVGVDVYQNFSFKSVGNGGSVGLGFDF